jgi:hypothetical protein
MAAIWELSTPAGNIRRPSEALLGQWIKTAWDGISPESIVKGFKKVLCVKRYEWNRR